MHKARAVLGAEMPPPVVVVPSPEPSGHYSIVIPAFNEGRRIEATICTIVAYMETHHGRYEIVVSDDGSTGSTRDIEELLQKGLPITLVRSERDRGKGSAVRQGIAVSTGR